MNDNQNTQRSQSNDERQEKLLQFLRDLQDQVYEPCGCWKSRRTGETFIFCAKHLQEDEAQQ